ncbi:DUF4440 domain-containing protein [Acinetobacter nematophilus]|uniref:DUF4440 domain-containing protein n=1 Tax=Acinetobacter nematophilus TaxID=2994642 RepID=A0A9X3E4X4_9GAMM|nr:DUF4440 domain-containing protein [Acinetobacter nematophilus]MCX5469529.1 hypothetical protein [Acinetobacter nematophilus]
MQETLAQLIQFECQLHHSERRNLTILDLRLHTDFKEITKSGQVMNKSQMLDALLNDLDTNMIHAQDFELQQLSAHSALLTYLSYQVDTNTQVKYNSALRSSIWVMNDQQFWQMIFHQGTLCSSAI